MRVKKSRSEYPSAIRLSYLKKVGRRWRRGTTATTACARNAVSAIGDISSPPQLLARKPKNVARKFQYPSRSSQPRPALLARALSFRATEMWTVWQRVAPNLVLGISVENRFRRPPTLRESLAADADASILPWLLGHVARWIFGINSPISDLQYVTSSIFSSFFFFPRQKRNHSIIV